MKKYIFLIVTIVLASYGFAQSLERSVFASSGNFTATSTMSISSTLGEVFVTTLSTSSTILTQGFQQSTVTSGGGGGTDGIENLISGEFSVYPNPFNDVINLKSTQKGNFTINIIDVLGRNLNVDYTNVNSNGKLDLKLDLREYQTGLYFVKIYDDLNHLKTIKIQKQ